MQQSICTTKRCSVLPRPRPAPPLARLLLCGARGWNAAHCRRDFFDQHLDRAQSLLGFSAALVAQLRDVDGAGDRSCDVLERLPFVLAEETSIRARAEQQ